MEDRNSGARNSTVTTRRQSTAPTPLSSMDWSTCEVGFDAMPYDDGFLDLVDYNVDRLE